MRTAPVAFALSCGHMAFTKLVRIIRIRRQEWALSFPAPRRPTSAGQTACADEEGVDSRTRHLWFGRRGDQGRSLLPPGEDFILGTLLGYDREQQCLRYLDGAGR